MIGVRHRFCVAIKIVDDRGVKSGRVDIMVIERQVDDRGEKMVRLRQAVGSIGVGVDVLVYSEAEVEERRDWCTSPIYWALREGRTLYAAQ